MTEGIPEYLPKVCVTGKLDPGGARVDQKGTLLSHDRERCSEQLNTYLGVSTHILYLER